MATASVGAVGYRVVHGGARFAGPTLVDDATVGAIEAVAEFAPLHNAIAAETIRAGRGVLPGIPHVAAFDTAFHASLPAAELLGRPADVLRLVVAHLGSGCSVTAVDAGRAVDTWMGMTPLEGLMMGTRAGSLDPGILLALLRHGRLLRAGLEDILDHRSGLLGVSGRSAGR